jgi:hypothetical protein
MPPHCTHHLQPADVSLVGAFNGSLIAAMAVAGALSMQFKISSSIKTAVAAATVYPTDAHGYTNYNWTSEFRKCGIFPYNPVAIDPLEYVPAASRVAARGERRGGTLTAASRRPCGGAKAGRHVGPSRGTLARPGEDAEAVRAHGKTVAAAQE